MKNFKKLLQNASTLLQIDAAFFLLQNCGKILLQHAVLLQNAAVITNCADFITKRAAVNLIIFFRHHDHKI